MLASCGGGKKRRNRRRKSAMRRGRTSRWSPLSLVRI